MCGGGTWKREVLPDHKFDFIDTREFTDNSFGMRMKYLWLYVIILKGFFVYISDIFTAVTMLSTDSWSNAIFNSCSPDLHNGCVAIPFNVGKWLFFGCIIFSFLLLAYEGYKSKKIIQSRDISYAFTNVMANNYYSLRSYDHFCFFDHISASTKRMDDFAFFVFFTFKSWKRLLFADGPRQTINALTLYAFYLSKQDKGPWWDLSKYFAGNNFVTTGLTISTAFTVLVFAGSALLLIVAGLCYIPLLCHIQGNLKEYCCHKVDKRIAEIIKRKNKQRQAKAQALAKKEAAGDFSHLKNKKGEMIGKPLPQPTLPNISLDDEETGSVRTGAAPSTYTSSSDYYHERKEYMEYPMEYPPMPAFSQPYGNHQYNPSVGTLPTEDQHYDDNDYGSTANLTLGAAPVAYPDDQPRTNNMFAPQGHGAQAQHGLYAYHNDPHAAYRGQSPANGSAAPPYRGPSPAPSHSDLAYGDPYGGYTQQQQQQPQQYSRQQQQQQQQQQQYHQHAQDPYGRGYPANDHQRESDGYDYGAGQVHAM
ncbi:hypothetical protein BDW22DRAFT_1481012 [Trametopsis cervina]|nr:hypothetical protein BDW22DRAFT_1481012 [Trametopsis cervina]